MLPNNDVEEKCNVERKQTAAHIETTTTDHDRSIGADFRGISDWHRSHTNFA